MRIENSFTGCNLFERMVIVIKDGKDKLDEQNISINIQDDDEFTDRWKTLIGSFIQDMYDEIVSYLLTFVVEDTLDDFMEEYLKLPEESDMEAIETGIKYRNIAPVIGPLMMCKLSRELQFGDLRADASITNLLIQLYDENLRLTIGDLINNVFFLMKDKSFFAMDGEGNRYRFKINMRVPDLKKQIKDLLK